jgi:hypothetical protein
MYVYNIYMYVCMYITYIYNSNNHNNNESEPQQAHERNASGQLAAMCPHTTTYLHYMCVLIIREKSNRRTKETPKGNNRCRQCKEERYFPKDLLVKNPLADLQVSVFVLFYLYFSTSNARKLNPLADLQVSLFVLFY